MKVYAFNGILNTGEPIIAKAINGKSVYESLKGILDTVEANSFTGKCFHYFEKQLQSSFEINDNTILTKA